MLDHLIDVGEYRCHRGRGAPLVGTRYLRWERRGEHRDGHALHEVCEALGERFHGVARYGDGEHGAQHHRHGQDREFFLHIDLASTDVPLP